MSAVGRSESDLLAEPVRIRGQTCVALHDGPTVSNPKALTAVFRGCVGALALVRWGDDANPGDSLVSWRRCRHRRLFGERSVPVRGVVIRRK